MNLGQARSSRAHRTEVNILSLQKQRLMRTSSVLCRTSSVSATDEVRW